MSFAKFAARLDADALSGVVQHYNETWQAMEELCDQGLCHAIGVSNFSTAQIDDLIAHASKYRPAVNQVRLFVWQFI